LVLFHEKKTTLYFLLASVLVGSILNGISVVYSTEDHSLLFPTGVAVDSSSNVYVIDSWNDSIQKFTSDGKFITKWGSRGLDDGQFFFPTGVAVDSSSNVYISDIAASRIQKFTSDGKFITKWGSRGLDDGQFFNPVSVAVDSLSNVYVVDQGNDRIQKFTSDGKFITTWGIQRSDDGNFFNPKGVAVDSSSNVYVVDQNNNRIQKFTSDGKFITKWGSKCIPSQLSIAVYGACPKPGDREFWYPDGGIAVDSSSNVYVVDQNNNRIQKFTSDGKFITKWAIKASDDDQIGPPLRSPSEGPSGIAVDSKAGKLYVIVKNEQIQSICCSIYLPGK
jgi:tripartite motif-containing protein 71